MCCVCRASFGGPNCPLRRFAALALVLAVVAAPAAAQCPAENDYCFDIQQCEVPRDCLVDFFAAAVCKEAGTSAADLYPQITAGSCRRNDDSGNFFCGVPGAAMTFDACLDDMYGNQTLAPGIARSCRTRGRQIEAGTFYFSTEQQFSTGRRGCLCVSGNAASGYVPVVPSQCPTPPQAPPASSAGPASCEAGGTCGEVQECEVAQSAMLDKMATAVRDCQASGAAAMVQASECRLHANSRYLFCEVAGPVLTLTECLGQMYGNRTLAPTTRGGADCRTRSKPVESNTGAFFVGTEQNFYIGATTATESRGCQCHSATPEPGSASVATTAVAPVATVAAALVGVLVR